MNHLLTQIIAAIMSIGSLFGHHPLQAAPIPTLGAFNPTGGGTYRLQTSIGGSATSLTLTSFKEPVSNIPYTMSYLNSTIEYATIEPQSTTKEFISFTGITQNSDGSATLTGISRGLGFSYPFTASTTLQQSHSAQSILILSNPPQLYNQYAQLAGNNTFTGQNTFNVFPITPNNATSSYDVAGVAQLATPANQAAGTATSSNGNQAPLILAAKNATSTWNANTSVNVIPVTGATGRLAAGFLASTTPTMASSTLQSDGSNNLYWLPVTRLIQTDSFTSATIANGSTTVFTATVPANALGVNGIIRGKLIGSFNGGNRLVGFDLAYGSASTTLMINPTGAVNPQPFSIDFYIKGNGATNSQKTALLIASTSPLGASTFPIKTQATSTPAIDSTASQRLQMIVNTNNADTAYSFDFVTLELLR